MTMASLPYLQNLLLSVILIWSKCYFKFIALSFYTVFDFGYMFTIPTY